jgi:prophage antirepressor-like protein
MEKLKAICEERGIRFIYDDNIPPDTAFYLGGIKAFITCRNLSEASIKTAIDLITDKVTLANKNIQPKGGFCSMNNLIIFKHEKFGQIRKVDVDGRQGLVAADVAKALGYKDTTNAIKQHCRGVVKHHLWVTTGTKTDGSPATRKTEANIIFEPDLYRLAAHSKLPGAEEFESWIFEEVLPSIRKHGAYMTPTTLEEMLLNPDSMIKMLTALKDEREKNNSLFVENEKQKQVIGELKPKADYVDLILSSVGSLTTTQIAADYGISARKLNQILREERIQRFVGDQWILYIEHMDKGYTKSETIHFKRSDGRPGTKMFTKWTQKGRLMINQVLNGRGIYANVDLIQSA